MSQAGSIADTDIGLTQSELLILRQQTEVAAQSRAGGSAMADRGRGISRHSQPSSRAASAASSHSIQGRITMDSSSLGRIENALNHLVRQIQDRIQQLEEASEQSVANNQRGAVTSIKAVDDEILRAKKIMQELDRLDAKLEEVNNVCAKIKILRKRCDAAGGRMDDLAMRRAGGRPR